MRSTFRPPSTAPCSTPSFWPEVYIDLIGARQSQLILAAETRDTAPAPTAKCRAATRRTRCARVTEADRQRIGPLSPPWRQPIWNDFLLQLACLSSALRRRNLRRLSGGLPFQVFWRYDDEIDRISIRAGNPPSRTEVAMISRGEGEQQPGHSI